MKYFFTETNVSLTVEGGVEARMALAKKEGFDVSRLTCAEQVHSADVVVVDNSLVGSGSLDLESRIPHCDALITNIPGIPLMMLTADCVPVLLYDRVHNVVAAIHAGWKGTASRIVPKTIERMSSDFGTESADVEAFIGPCICGSCFEVGHEVVSAIGQRFVSGTSDNNKPLLDLKLANTVQLTESGMDILNIHVSPSCTFHNNLPSWRRSKTLERIGSGIMI